MNKRKLGIIQPSKKERAEILSVYPLDQVYEMLNGYLSGGVTIRSDPKRAYLLKSRNKPSTDEY